MSTSSQQDSVQERFADIFAQLRDQDIEQFYANYQLWVMQHRIPILESEIEALHAHLAENQQCIRNLRPSAIALAVLARLQAHGVSDVALLDQMLERGEDWLDRMMQRLDYCEQVEDFIQGDYTQWCVNSLEGAYDWIDSVRGSTKEAWPEPQTEETTTASEAQATAELLLHKLSIDDEEAMQQITKPFQLTHTDAHLEMQVEAEEHLADAEHLTEAQALEILALTSEEALSENESETNNPITLLDGTQPEQVSSSESAGANPQPAPWYSVRLEEHESFDFERPGSMDDWIAVLQSDISTQLAIDTAQSTPVQATEQPSTTTPSEQSPLSERTASAQLAHHNEVTNPELTCAEITKSEPIHEDAVNTELMHEDVGNLDTTQEHIVNTTSMHEDVGNLDTTQEHIVHTELIHEAVIGKDKPTSDEIEAASEHAATILSASEVLQETDESLSNDQVSTETIVCAEPESVQPEPEILETTKELYAMSSEVTVPKGRALQQAKKMLKNKNSGKSSKKSSSSPNKQSHASETLTPANPEQAQPPPIEDMAETQANIMEEQFTDQEKPNDEITSEDPQLPTAREESVPLAEDEIILEDQQPRISVESLDTRIDEEVLQHTESATRLAQEAIQITEATPDESVEKGGIINAIFEPDESQLPWYEYLVMEQMQREKSPGAEPNYEHDALIDDESDKTQPIALKEIRQAQQMLNAVQFAEDTHEREVSDNSKYEHIDVSNMAQEANGIIAIEEVQTKDEIQHLRVQEDVSSSSEQKQMKSENLRVEEEAQLIIETLPPVQKPSKKKISFWQRLWGGKRTRA